MKHGQLVYMAWDTGIGVCPPIRGHTLTTLAQAYKVINTINSLAHIFSPDYPYERIAGRNPTATKPVNSDASSIGKSRRPPLCPARNMTTDHNNLHI